MKKILSIFLLLFSLTILMAQDEETPEQRLDRMVNTLLTDYETYGQLVSDFNNPVISEEFKQAFKALFAPGTRIFNDIIGSSSYGQYISPSSYVDELEKRYPKGLSISLLGRRKIVELNDQKSKGYDFTLVMKVTKEFEGRNSQGEYESENVDLFITIGVSQGYKDAGIVSISNEFNEEETKEVKQATSGRSLEERKKERAKQEKERARRLASLSRRDRTRRERHQRIGFTWRPAFTQSRGFDSAFSNQFYRETQGTNDDVFNNINESLTLSPLAFTIDYNFFLNSNLGFGLGIGFAQSNYQLSGDISQVNYTWTGQDWDKLNTTQTSMEDIESIQSSRRHFRAINFSEKYKRTSLEVPISVIYKDRLGGTGSSIGWFVSANVKFDFVFDLNDKPRNTFEGAFVASNDYTFDLQNSNTSNSTLNFLEAKNGSEHGFNQIYYLYDDGEIYEGVVSNSSGFNTSQNTWGELSAGLEFRIFANPDIWLTVAPVFQWGLTDISKEKHGQNTQEALYKMRRSVGEDNNMVYGYNGTVWDNYNTNATEKVDYVHDEYRSLFMSQEAFRTHAYGLRIGVFYEFGKSRY